jgi:uncharacterized protein YneF (UPF0154 family)
MCGLSTPVVILILIIEAFVIGYFIVGWFKSLAEYENQRYKNPPPKIDGRITYEMLQNYVKANGEPAPYHDHKEDVKEILAPVIVAMAALAIYLYIYFS